MLCRFEELIGNSVWDRSFVIWLVQNTGQNFCSVIGKRHVYDCCDSTSIEKATCHMFLGSVMLALASGTSVCTQIYL